MEVVHAPAEQQVVVDPVTGAEIVRLTTHPAQDGFDYYEPSKWGPDDRRLVFLTDRIDGRWGQPATVDVETGEITVYTMPYHLEGVDWSPDGRHLYGIGELSGPATDPMLRYFITIDIATNEARALALRYPVEELPEEVRTHPEVVDDISDGYYRNDAFYPHLNPSGTLAAIEMYNVLAIVDVESLESWIVGRWSTRATFFDDEHVVLEPAGDGSTGNGLRTVDVNSREIVFYPVFNETGGEVPQCNHGGYSYRDGQMSKIYCPGPVPDHAPAFSIFDLWNSSFTIVSENVAKEGECCDPPLSASEDETRVAGRYHWHNIGVYDLPTDTVAVAFPPGGYLTFGDEYLYIEGPDEADYGGSTMISHDGEKVAFNAIVYDSKSAIDEAAEWMPVCKREDSIAANDASSDAETDLDAKCQELTESRQDVFVVYMSEDLFISKAELAERYASSNEPDGS